MRNTVGMLIVFVCFAGFVAACGGGSDSPSSSGASAATAATATRPTPATAATDSPVPEATTIAPTKPAPTFTPAKTATSSPVPLVVGPEDRLIIPAIGVDAPLTLGAVGEDGVTPNPNGPDDVIVYDLSHFDGLGGRPGEGNTVVYGHLDSRGPCKNGTVPGPCKAVFYDLRNLSLGDEITLEFGGETFDYTVGALCNVARDDYPQSIFESGQPERLTLLTDAYLGSPPNLIQYQTIIVAGRASGDPLACPAGTIEGAWPTG
jgi:Sortase domain